MSKFREKCIQAINKQGLLLVYPIDNRPDPASLWSNLHPKTKMLWEWDNDGDAKVAGLWQMKTELSESREVVYSKWYQNRATFFSKTLWTALYRLSREWRPAKWTRESSNILETLEMDSPLSTKQIKQATELQGRMLEPLYERGMRPLWQHFDIVAFGEFEDSSFPSLAVGSAKNLFEDLVTDAEKLSVNKAQAIMDQYMPQGSLWRKFWDKTANPKP